MRSLIQPTQRVLARATGLANATTLIAAVAPAAAAAAAVSATGVAHQRLHAQPARIFSAATILRSPAPAAATTPAATAAASAGGGHSPSSGGGSGGGTAIVMLNMGGPSTVPEVGPFLTRLFSDPEIIALGPFQKWAGPLMAKRRTPKIEEQVRRGQTKSRRQALSATNAPALRRSRPRNSKHLLLQIRGLPLNCPFRLVLFFAVLH
jgi:hypothetical protein